MSRSTEPSRQTAAFPSCPGPGQHAGYLYTEGSRSPGCVRGSGRAVVGTPRSRRAPGRCGRCTAYMSRCSTSPLPRSTLPRVRGKWWECSALASAPQSHLRGRGGGDGTESKHKKLFTCSFFNCQRNGGGGVVGWVFALRERKAEVPEE